MFNKYFSKSRFGNQKKDIASLSHRRLMPWIFWQRDHLKRKSAIFMASFEISTMVGFSKTQLGEKKRKEEKKKKKNSNKKTPGSSYKHVWCHCRSMRYVWYYYLHIVLVLRCFLDTTSTIKKQIPLTRFMAIIIWTDSANWICKLSNNKFYDIKQFITIWINTTIKIC